MVTAVPKIFLDPFPEKLVKLAVELWMCRGPLRSPAHDGWCLQYAVAQTKLILVIKLHKFSRQAMLISVSAAFSEAEYV